MLVKFSIALEGDKSFEAYRTLAKMAEEKGFHSVQIYEHVGFRPCWSILYYLAVRTKRVFLGPLTIPVLLNHPAYVAAQIACLNELTRGRAILGISRGALYQRIGVTLDRPFTAVREAIEIITRLLEDGCISFKGKIFRASSDMRFYWRYRARKVRLYIGTSGPKMTALAASIPSVGGIVTDNLWNPLYFGKLRGWVRKASASHDRDATEFEIIPRPFCSVAESRSEAERLAYHELRQYLPGLMGKSLMLNYAGVDYKQLQKLKGAREIPHRIISALIRNFSATGTIRDIEHQVEDMVRAGAHHICFGHPLGKDPAATIRQLGQRVLPSYQEA